MKSTYTQFVSGKLTSADAQGFTIEQSTISQKLFPFQRDIVSWALEKGRSAIFADCGLGKTPMQLEWAANVARHTSMPVIIFAPLAVAEQTRREGVKFSVPVTVCRTQHDVQPGVNIANYEMMAHFRHDAFAGIVIDESSILKAYDGKTKRAIVDFADTIPYRLACTATPAPNDLTEIINHAEFLGIMRENEVKALFFTQDGNSTTEWRLKGHARQDFWRWVATWCVALRTPADVGYDDDGFQLPPMEFVTHIEEMEWVPDGSLFPTEAITLHEQRAARRESIPVRVARVAELVASEPDEPWIIWCDLNDESAALTKAIPGAVEVTGSDSQEHKESAMLGFADGSIRVLVTKPRIAGFGMNWQHCARVVFAGVSHSYEQQYQAIRRCWRFGQERTVFTHIVTSAAEARVVSNVKHKEAQARIMMDEIVRHMGQQGAALNARAKREEMDYEREVVEGETWTAHLGDCVDVTEELEDDSIGLSIFSPPFPGMYVYTNSLRDMGNVANIAEMIEHFRFLARPLLRKTQPGRTCAVHLTQINAKKGVDGYTGLKDFRGATIQMMEEVGWIYYGEVCVDKNPQVKAIRTKDAGLQFKSLATDSSKMHMAMADYVLQFRKPGDNTKPIRAGISSKYKNADGWITQEEWIRWARPVWYAADYAPDGDGISETDTLNVHQARETDDERHLAPLQLGLIERAVKLWSAPGELVFSPFMGIGSEGYVATRLGRRFIGSELKRGYWKHAVKNLRRADADAAQNTLFGALASSQ